MKKYFDGWLKNHFRYFSFFFVSFIKLYFVKIISIVNIFYELDSLISIRCSSKRVNEFAKFMKKQNKSEKKSEKIFLMM